MHTGKMTLTLLLSALILCIACSASAETEAPDYYHIGLQVTRLMSEMVDSDDYQSVLGTPESSRQIRERANTHDYSCPVAVYSLRMADPRALMERFVPDDQETREAFNRLSPAIQDQYLARINISLLSVMMNTRSGYESVAFLTSMNGFIRSDSLTSEDPVHYLYLFQKGIPILVTFEYHKASGQFLDIPVEYQHSPADIPSYLQIPGFFELTPVAAPVPSGNLADYGIDPQEAIQKMVQSVGENLPANGRVLSGLYEPSDITGDGCMDLFTCVTWGSGTVRTVLAVYDPVHEYLYVLDGYNYDYLIDHAEEERIVIVKQGPNGYDDPVTRTYGSVKLENRQLIFVSGAQEQR